MSTTAARVGTADATPTSEASLKSSVTAAEWQDAEKGKLNHQQLLQLVADSTKDTVPQGLSKLLLSKRPGDARRLVDVLQDTNQAALLQQLLQGCCEAEEDLLVAAIQNKCSFKFIKALWEEPGYASDATRQAWHRGLSSTVTDTQPAGVLTAPAPESFIPWHALSHPDPRVLQLVLSGQAVDATAVLSDGSNLLHAAVDAADCSKEHVTALLEAMWQRLRPEDFFGDHGSGHLPKDLNFIEHRTPDELSVLFKVIGALEKLQQAEAERRSKERAKAAQQVKMNKSQRREQQKLEALNRRQAKLAKRLAAGQAVGDSSSDSSSSSEYTTDDEAADEDPTRAAERSRLEELMYTDAAVIDGSGPSSSSSRHVATAATVSSSAGQPRADAAGSSSSISEQVASQAAMASPSKAAAAGEGGAASSSNKVEASEAATSEAARMRFEARNSRLLNIACLLLAAGADPLAPVKPVAQGMATKVWALFRTARSGSETTTAFDCLPLVEPKDHLQYDEDEWREVCKKHEKRKERRALKRKAKPGKQEMKPTELLKADKEREPTNPMVFPEFEPTELEAAMLRAAVRSYAIKAGSTEGAMELLQAKLKSKPKVCVYLERTYMARDKKHPELKTLQVSDVWVDVKETFALTMLRYHSKSPQELRPYIKASDPAFMAVDPWANLLWLGLGAPPPIFQMLLQECSHVSRGNPIACEYSTGGNFLHAVLQYKALDANILEMVLTALNQDKRNKGRVH